MSSSARRGLALLGAIVALRAVGFLVGVVNIDEADFAVVARMVAAGEHLYTGIVDIKPPLAYVAFLPGVPAWPSLWPMRLVGDAVLWATCLVVRRIAEHATRDTLAGWCAAWAVLLASLCEVPSVNVELLMGLPLALALLAVVRGGAERPLLAGLLAGLALGVGALFKHQALAWGPALAAGVVLGPDARARGDASVTWGARLGGVGLLALGTALPAVLCVVVWARAGELPAFVDWVVVRNLRYAGREPGSALARLALSLAECLGVAPLVWLAAARGGLEARGRVRAIALTALAGTAVAVSAGGRFYEHYFLQFASLVGVLAAPVAARTWRDRARWSRTRRAMLATALGLPVLVWLGFLGARAARGDFPGQNAVSREVGTWLRARAATGDRLAVWGHHAPLYLDAGLLAGTRYLTTSVLVGNFDPGHLPPGADLRAFVSAPDVARLLEDLEVRRPTWFVDLAPSGLHHADRVPLSLVPELAAYVRARYALAGRPAGADVYRRRAEATAGAGAGAGSASSPSK